MVSWVLVGWIAPYNPHPLKIKSSESCVPKLQFKVTIFSDRQYLGHLTEKPVQNETAAQKQKNQEELSLRTIYKHTNKAPGDQWDFIFFVF